MGWAVCILRFYVPHGRLILNRMAIFPAFILCLLIQFWYFARIHKTTTGYTLKQRIWNMFSPLEYAPHCFFIGSQSELEMKWTLRLLISESWNLKAFLLLTALWVALGRLSVFFLLTHQSTFHAFCCVAAKHHVGDLIEWNNATTWCLSSLRNLKFSSRVHTHTHTHSFSSSVMK